MTEVNLYEDWVFDHLRYLAAHKLLVEEIELVLRGGPRVVVALLGPSGMGKSELLKDIGERFADRVTDTGRSIVLRVSFPAGSTSDAVAARIIMEILGLPIVKGSRSDKRERAIRLLKSSGIRVVVLDETNHAAEARSTRATQTNANRLTADWIKEIVEEAKVSVILAGLPHSRRVLTDNEQLEGRALRPIEMHPYAWHIETDRGAFCRLVEGFAGYARANGWTFTMPPDHLIRATYLTSRGLVRPVKDLFQRALTLSGKDRTVTAAVFARAFDRLFAERPIGNPFELEKITDEMLNAAHRQLLNAIHEPMQHKRQRKGHAHHD
jgi:hypothetical protein